MKIIDRFDGVVTKEGPIILAVGCFDGIHKGHQKLIRHSVNQAQNEGGQAWVLTFDPHPAKILTPKQVPPLLMSIEYKLKQLDTLGIHGCLIIPFNRQIAKLEPETFIEKLYKAIPRLKQVMVGPDWTFGHQARGTPARLKGLGEQHGFEVSIIETESWKGSPISSTRIRQAVRKGLMADATAMLSGPFSIQGEVVEGQKRGRTLGFPTANIENQNELQPSPGIYAAFSVIDGIRYNGAAYIPMDSPNNIVEIYFFDASHDLYKQKIEIFFVEFIRKDQHFPTQETLVEHIRKDVESAKKILYFEPE
ncbi:MAG: riboflavin biosynthesis protein RibF [Kiritimatiellae bacterium]|nr:riboflavin biosynthesis protein RibF [Kiritimatiellia bacterium]